MVEGPKIWHHCAVSFLSLSTDALLELLVKHPHPTPTHEINALNPKREGESDCEKERERKRKDSKVAKEKDQQNSVWLDFRF